MPRRGPPLTHSERVRHLVRRRAVVRTALYIRYPIIHVKRLRLRRGGASACGPAITIQSSLYDALYGKV